MNFPWKAKKHTKAELSEFRTSAVCRAVRRIKCPQAAKLDDLMGKLQGGVLLLEQPLDLPEVAYLFFHAKMSGIKEIRIQNWRVYDPDDTNIKSTRSKLAEYLGVNPPEDLFRLQHFWNSVDQCLRFPIDVDLQGFEYPSGTIGGCIFPETPGWQPSADEDILKMRYAVARPNYVPTFLYGSDRVTRGFVYDLQQAEWSSNVAYCGDGNFYAPKNLWETVYPQFQIYGLEAIYDFNADIKTWQQLESALSGSITWHLQNWVLNLVLTGFLNFNSVGRPKLASEAAARYSGALMLPEKYRRNRKLAIIGTYPKCFILVKDNFHPALNKEDIELLVGGESLSRHDICQLPDQLSTEFTNFIYKGNKPKLEKEIFDPIVKFAIKEVKNDRPWLAVGLAFILWESMEKDHTKIAMKIAEYLPEAIVPRFIRLAFKEHGRTRFERHMVF